MTKVLAGITTSIDGYVAGPGDGPGKGLGEDGERLHYWSSAGGGRTRTARSEPSKPPAARTSTSWAEPTSSVRRSRPGSSTS